ncbi:MULTISPECIES: acyl-CoA dehydrogenase [unclassified Streptomyces]|uniref:acyl-CoA dehydrogenase n=1 Tax=unclassified Streptomyces TaxID=2593676 RepID=UPI002259EF18|nr:MULTISPECIES: acyl-CoA dehydrogenase [unclassified Streptomyces]MCX5328740.1 acyl-CoA dehydrogenase [Streptomyces sp. NBC_00140]MCX5358147.1 acyl-CoA dehydrogenase [Streptomyces sp. NBC_00124]
MAAYTAHVGRVPAPTQRPSLLATTPIPARAEEWLDRIDAVAPLIRAHRDQAERDRATPEAVVKALCDAGVHRMWVGRHFRGRQVSLATGSAVLQYLARLDASVAWQMGVQGAIGRLSDYLPEPAARTVFAEHNGLVVGDVHPTGQARRVPGGYRLTGTWAFAGGSAHADWLVCAATAQDKDGDTDGDETKSATRLLFIPQSAATLLDTWHSVGLPSTGSTHFEVEEVFVPDGFTVDGAALLRPPPRRASRAYDIGYYDFGPFTTASTALGIAQDSLETFRQLLPKDRGAVSPVAQAGFARAEMRVRRAGLLLADTAKRASVHGQDGGEPLSALVKLTAATVAEDTAAAVDTVYDLAGSRTVYTSARLERCFRDIHTAVKHITLSATHFETVGRYLLADGPALHR